DWLHTGGMVQVGLAWRLLDAPSAEEPPPPPGGGGGNTGTASSSDPVVVELLKQLTELDKNAPPPSPTATPETIAYYKKRVAIVEQLYAKTQKKEREDWLRQLADNHSTLAQSAPKDKAALQRLGQLREQIVREAPGSNLAALVTYRELWAEHGPQIGPDSPDVQKAQEKWMEALAKFVQQYPKADDAPKAPSHLAKGRDAREEAE